MGYLDSCHLVFKYLKAKQFDHRMKNDVTMQEMAEKSSNDNMSNLMLFNRDVNKARTERYYDAQTATIQNQLNQLQADPKADQNTVNQLNQQIEDVKKQKELALARLQAQFDTDNRKMSLKLNQRDSYYEKQKELWDERLRADSGRYETAKTARDAALNAMYPKPTTTTTT